MCLGQALCALHAVVVGVIELWIQFVEIGVFTCPLGVYRWRRNPQGSSTFLISHSRIIMRHFAAFFSLNLVVGAIPRLPFCFIVSLAHILMKLFLKKNALRERYFFPTRKRPRHVQFSQFSVDPPVEVFLLFNANFPSRPPRRLHFVSLIPTACFHI